MNSIKQNNLFVTYKLSESDNSKGAIILLDGLPSKPESKQALIEKLSTNNYDVFFPHYEGTWNSEGEFLERLPSITIAELIRSLKSGIDLNGAEYTGSKVFVIASSFGGGIALDLARMNVTDKICVTSPVVSFRKVPGLATLEEYIISVHASDYRFKSENWAKMLNDELWNLDDVDYQNPENILIVAGKDDDQVLLGDVVSFSENKNIELIVEDFGHITLSKISDEMLYQILKFFSK